MKSAGPGRRFAVQRGKCWTFFQSAQAALIYWLSTLGGVLWFWHPIYGWKRAVQLTYAGGDRSALDRRA